MSLSTRFISLKLSGIFHFRICLVFFKVFIFVQGKAWTLWLQNVIISFKIKILEQHDSFAPRSLIFKMQQNVWKFNNICVSWSSPKPNLEMNFSILERFEKFWERQFSNFKWIHGIPLLTYLFIYLTELKNVL